MHVHLVRILRGAPPRVFDMLSEPVELARWWGPRGFTTSSVEIDLCVGGRYRILMQPPEGDAFYLSGEFLEVRRPIRLAYSFAWEEPAADDRDNVVTLTLREVGGATELVVDHGPFATGARRALHEAGWTDSVDRLAEVLASPSESV